MTLKEQGIFLIRCSEMLNNGFNLLEVLSLLSKLRFHQSILNSMIHDLQTGDSIYQALLRNHFDKQVCTQIYFAEKHGYISKTLHEAGSYLLKKEEGKKKLVKLLQYPLILLLALFVVTILLNTLLLPRIQILYTSMAHDHGSHKSFSLQVLSFLPYYLLLILLLGLLIFFICKWSVKKKSAVSNATFFSKLPFIGSYYTLYQTFFIAREWSSLLRCGYSFSEIITIMREQTFLPLLHEMATDLRSQLINGKKLSDALSIFAFFEKDLASIIAHGEYNGRLDSELQFYSKVCFERLEEKLTKLFLLIQPIIFLFIGLLIITIYMAIFLPMFQLIENI